MIPLTIVVRLTLSVWLCSHVPTLLLGFALGLWTGQPGIGRSMLRRRARFDGKKTVRRETNAELLDRCANARELSP